MNLARQVTKSFAFLVTVASLFFAVVVAAPAATLPQGTPLANLAGASLALVHSPQFGTLLFVAILCAPMVAVIEIKHHRSKRRKAADRDMKKAVAYFKATQARMNWRTWHENGEDDLWGATYR